MEASPSTCMNFKMKKFRHLLSNLKGYNWWGTNPSGKVFDKIPTAGDFQVIGQGLHEHAHWPAYNVIEIEFIGSVRVIWHVSQSFT
jgi:hypothetical protein